MSDACPFVSIVVPTFDRHGALASCLASLGTQEFPADRTEVVVVNDGGTPVAPDLTRRLRERLTVSVIDALHGGPAAARNVGVARCRGDILAFIDDDCVADRGWLRALVVRLGQHPQAAVGGRVINSLPTVVMPERVTM